MLDVTYASDGIRFGERLVVSFHRTLRIPEDGRTYPLPPGFGRFPIVQLESVPSAAMIPMYQREALWIAFNAPAWRPNAIKVIVGGINAVSGLPDDGARLNEPQDYVVCPDQLWLDGVNVGDGVIRQFVAMPLGEGYAVEASYGREEQGGIEIVAFEPRPGHFPDEPPPERPGGPARFRMPRGAAEEPRRMALGAGGTMRQKIYPDPHGLAVWDPDNRGRARLELVNSTVFRELTGREPPQTPIDAATYTEHGLPWFELYDEGKGTVAPGAGTPRLRTVGERDAERRIARDDEPVSEPRVEPIRPGGKRTKE